MPAKSFAVAIICSWFSTCVWLSIQLSFTLLALIDTLGFYDWKMIFESTFKTATDFLYSSHVGTNDIFTPIILNLVFPLITSPEPPTRHSRPHAYRRHKIPPRPENSTKKSNQKLDNKSWRSSQDDCSTYLKKKSRWLLYFIITNKKQKTSIKNIDMNPFKISFCCGYYFIFMWHNILPLRKPVTSKAAKSTFKPWRLGHSELAEVEEKVQAFFIIITTYWFFLIEIFTYHYWWIFLIENCNTSMMNFPWTLSFVYIL